MCIRDRPQPSEPNASSAPMIASPSSTPRPVPWGTIAIGLWLLGAVAVLLAFLAAYLGLRRWIARAEPVREEEWNTLAMEAADRLGLRTPFELLRGDGFAVPIAVGLTRPRVLLPSGSESWSVELRRAVLLHELAHIQRHDCLTQAMAQIACAVFWFHPAFWWAASQMRACLLYTSDAA